MLRPPLARPTVSTARDLFSNYIVVVDDDADRHNTSIPTRRDRLCANTDPPRDSIFTKGPSDVLDHATSEIAITPNREC